MEILRTTDPHVLFQNWLKDARKSEPNDAEAMALATVGADGRPSVRMVLLKGVADGEFQFFTNMESRKGRELAASPHAALCFHWKSLLRQVRIEGDVRRIDDAAADAYFASRSVQSRLGAWASKQSQPLASRAVLEEAVEHYRGQYGDNPPRPPHWSGFVLTPRAMEFWHQRESRLHDRFLFTATGSGWDFTRLYP